MWLAGEIKTPTFSPEARIETGVLLTRLQRGEKLTMPGFRPMPSIGTRCGVLRVPDETANWRIMLRVDGDVIVILEVFAKKARTTPRKVIET